MLQARTCVFTILMTMISLSVWSTPFFFVYMCVCVWERERERGFWVAWWPVVSRTKVRWPLHFLIYTFKDCWCKVLFLKLISLFHPSYLLYWYHCFVWVLSKEMLKLCWKITNFEPRSTKKRKTNPVMLFRVHLLYLHILDPSVPLQVNTFLEFLFWNDYQAHYQ